MNCYQARQLLGSYLDGEVVDPEALAEIERHIADGEACAEDLQALTALAKAVRAKATYFKAPEGLEARIRAQAGLKRL